MKVKHAPKIKSLTKLNDLSLLFDLDGSSSNSLPHNYRATVRASRFFGLHKPTLEEVRKHFDPSGEFAGYHKKIGVPDKLKLIEPGKTRSIYGTKWMEFYSEEIESGPPDLSPGFRSLVERLSARGVTQYIFSLATQEHIEKQIGDLQKHFKDFVSIKGSKMVALAHLKERLGNDFLVHIGDTVYDGISTVSVGVMFGAILHECSYNTEEALRRFVELNHRSSFTINGFENFEEDISKVNFIRN